MWTHVVPLYPWRNNAERTSHWLFWEEWTIENEEWKEREDSGKTTTVVEKLFNHSKLLHKKIIRERKHHSQPSHLYMWKFSHVVQRGIDSPKITQQVSACWIPVWSSFPTCTVNLCPWGLRETNALSNRDWNRYWMTFWGRVTCLERQEGGGGASGAHV